jgi:hypothetical protein
MRENSYQGYEVQKHRAIMMGKMYFQLIVLCLAAQLLLLLALIPLQVNLAYQMVPAPHREFALKWPVALLERAFYLDGTFQLHSEKGKPHWWSGAKVDVVEVSAAQLVAFPYTQVFTSKGAHWGLVVVLSFLAWPLGFLARRRWGEVVRGVRSRRL